MRHKLTYSYTHYISLNGSLVSNKKNAKNYLIGYILHNGNWSFLVFSQAPEHKINPKLYGNIITLRD